MKHLLPILFVFAPAICKAEPYWVSWDSGWPEEQGWTWGATDPGPDRWLDDGTLYIDSRAAVGLAGGYYQIHPGMFSLGPSETFVVQWKAMVWEATYPDAGVFLTCDDQYAVGFTFSTDAVWSDYEPGLSAPLIPGLFHEFRFESSDFRAYRLYIDSGLALQGTLSEGLGPLPSYIGWGDHTTSRSLSQWDYMQYGVVPEPSALACLVGAGCLRSARGRTRAARRGLSIEEELP
jgi:hypothetical protein